MVHIERYNSPSESARHAGTYLTELLHTNTQVLLLLSGGSALKILDDIDVHIYAKNLTWGVLDERVSRDESINNFLQLKNHKTMQDINYIETIPHPQESPQEFAARYESLLREWIQNNPNGKIIATAGIGEDGHTFGMMPYPENPDFFNTLFVDTEKLVVGYDAGIKNKFPKRITATGTLAKMFEACIYYVVGESKKDALVRTLAPEGSLEATPARVIHFMRKVNVYTDII